MKSVEASPCHSLVLEKNNGSTSSPDHFSDELLECDVDFTNFAGNLSEVSLESLLQQDLDRILNIDDSATNHNPFLDVSDALSVASRTSASAVSHASFSSAVGQSRRQQKKGSILRHVVLKNISAQLLSGFSRIGAPTAVAVSAWLAVGANSGLTYIFDGGQNLRWCLGAGTGKDIESYGAVSAICFNGDCTRLLCGHVRGQIVMYDVTNGKLLRVLEDAHEEEATVLNIKFTENPTIAIFSDIQGNVYEINFTRTLGVRGYTSTCLYDGAKGPAVTIEPLSQFAPQMSPRFDSIVLALATLDKVMIVKLKPQRKVIFCQRLVGEPTSLPMLSWQYLTIQTSNGHVVDPVLANARGTSVNFVQLSRTRSGQYSVVPLISIALPYTVTSMGWVDARTLVTFDTKERLHLIDVKDQEEIEDMDLSNVGVVYSSGCFKGLATGITVNKNLASAGEYACYQSVIVSCGQVFLLGTRSVHAVILRRWQEKIDFLVKNKRHVEALSFGNQLIGDKAKAVIGFKPGSDRVSLVKEKMKEVIDDFVLTCIIPYVDDDAALRFFCTEHIPGCVANAVKLGLGSYVCDSIYSRVAAVPVLKAVFLESLETLILDDQLVVVNPVVAKDFVDHYESKGKLKVLESCLLHLDISCLDFNQVISLCMRRCLYTAMLYLHNKALDDYVGPLEDLFGILMRLFESQDDCSEEATEIGNTILVYISCCLGGRSYPYGLLPDEKAHHVAHEILSFLTSLHSKRSQDAERSYPYLRALLKVNTREFLNVLSMAFEESPLKNSDVGQRQRQRIVDILICIMVQSGGFDNAQIGALFTFIARQLAVPPLHLDRQLMFDVLEFITQPGTGERHEERQQALIELLQVPTVDFRESVGVDKLLAMAERAGFCRVCEDLYRALGQHDNVFRCLIRDDGRRHLAIPYMKSILAQKDNFWTKTLEGALLENVGPLLEHRMEELVEFLVKCEPGLVQRVLDTLRSNLEARYLFMGLLLEARSEWSSGGSSTLDIFGLFDDKFHLEYVRLMSKYDHGKMVGYLWNCSEDILGPDLLQICASSGSKGAEAVVLERLGEMENAFEKHLSNFKESLNSASNIVGNGPSLWKRCSEDASFVVRFCERNPEQKFWLALLDAVVEARNNSLAQELSDISQYVLSTVQTYVPPGAILQRVLNSSKVAKGTWADVKQLTLGMLDSYNYETTLYDISTRLFRSDAHRQLTRLKKKSTKAAVVSSVSCGFCSKPIAGKGMELKLFRCGHLFHVTCFSSSSEVSESASCQLCNSSLNEIGDTPHIVSVQPERLSRGASEEYSVNRADDLELVLQPLKRT